MVLVYEEALGEEAYGIVYLDEGIYSVYEIPLYGGEERYYKKCRTLEEAINMIKNELT